MEDPSHSAQTLVRGTLAQLRKKKCGARSAHNRRAHVWHASCKSSCCGHRKREPVDVLNTVETEVAMLPKSNPIKPLATLFARSHLDRGA